MLPALWRTTDETMVKGLGVIRRGMGGQGVENFKIYPDRSKLAQ